MFTGLVEDVGRVSAAVRRGEALDLEITPAVLPVAELGLGDSVAVDGTCLTVTERGGGRFRALAGPETLARTTLGALAAGASVNLERALRASDRLGGHMVSGHVDAVGTIGARTAVGPAVELRFDAPPDVLRYVVPKGSIAVDGISLTVNRVDEYSFAVALYPFTLEKTTLGAKQVGAPVNLEVDVIGKYVEKFVQEGLRASLSGRNPT
jgi:riboflavin synthase